MEEWKRDTYVDDHVSDNLIIGDEIRFITLRLEEPDEELFLLLAALGIFLHTLHKALDAEASGDGEVVELIEQAWPARITAKPVVERGDLADLDEVNTLRLLVVI